MRRYRALVEYDGTAYYGFQRQRSEYPTVQGALEAALTRLNKAPVSIIGSGRTDSGVHATGQVISFDLDWSHGPDTLQRALNVNLPKDIVVYQVVACAADFHPRFDAKRRAYVYHIYQAPLRSPLRRTRSWHVVRPLAMDQMNAAAACLPGVQDFATFGRPPQGTNTVREIFRAEWKRDGDYLFFHVEANAFLYRMVRSLVGCLKLVGEGRWTVKDFENAKNACDRRAVAVLAPAHGLYLEAVTY